VAAPTIRKIRHPSENASERSSSRVVSIRCSSDRVIPAEPLSITGALFSPGGSWPRNTLTRSPPAEDSRVTGGSTSDTGNGRAARQAPSSASRQSTGAPSTDTEVIVSSPCTSVTDEALPVR
jgi:hypothetical protein